MYFSYLVRKNYYDAENFPLKMGLSTILRSLENPNMLRFKNIPNGDSQSWNLTFTPYG